MVDYRHRGRDCVRSLGGNRTPDFRLIRPPGREQAKQARVRAKGIRDPDVRQAWLNIAEQYDNLARIAERNRY